MSYKENPYDQYLAEDFAQDEHFIQWVKVPDGVNHSFWEAWLKEHPEKHEEIAKAKTLVQLMQVPEPEPSSEQIEGMWTHIAKGIEKQPKLVKLQPDFWHLHRLKVAAAAMISILIVTFFLLRDTSETIRADLGQQLSYTLPDNSTITLNAGSEITFQPEDWENHRVVHLDGEAFFEVEKGGSFQVISERGKVEVLGTSFNVYARGQKLEVACLTGKIKVSDPQEKITQLLTPGKGVLFTNSDIEPFEIDIQKGIDWRGGNFIFEDVPLHEVLEELERQYDLEVVLQTDVQGRRYSGQFTAHDLTGALQMICLPMELTYTLDSINNKVIIRQE